MGNTRYPKDNEEDKKEEKNQKKKKWCVLLIQIIYNSRVTGTFSSSVRYLTVEGEKI